ncbi:hypothetical protein [Pseudomonas sp. MWU13-3659]|uniref:hypothetical protein n=1 Tax=Pseudomonas sp. MWU13-3659 TaxID=2986964 RepID=UPI00336A2CF0
MMHRHFFGCTFIEMLMVGESHRRSGLGVSAGGSHSGRMPGEEAVHLYQPFQCADAPAAGAPGVCRERGGRAPRRRGSGAGLFLAMRLSRNFSALSRGKPQPLSLTRPL